MTNRFLITVALAILGAVLAAGAVSAQVVGGGGSDVSINLPGGKSLPSVGSSLPACSNLTDDDGDGKVDLADPDCSGPTDGDESGSAGQAPAPAPSGGGSGGGNGGGTTTSPTPTTPTTPTNPEPPAPTGGGGKGGKVPNNLPDPKNPFNGGSGSSGNGGGSGKSQGKNQGSGGNGGKNSSGGKKSSNGGTEPDQAPAIRKADGAPTNSNPSVSIAPVGAAPIGVPNVVIDQFSIPPFLLPIYQACGTQYGVPWQVLASINRIETAFGTNLNVSTAGALGWMQFIPSTWEMYGVDANGDGRKDPYNPVDAICAAARYLKASGAATDLRGAIFSYNHADWYVDEVILYAQQYGKLPSGLIDSLTGLTEGAHFPIAAKARYADDISERDAIKRSTPRKGVTSGNAADVIGDSPTRRGIDIFSKADAPVVAVNDGMIEKIGKTKRMGRYIILKDAYGNEFIYSQLGGIAPAVPVQKKRELGAKDFQLVTPSADGGKNVRKPASSLSKGAQDAEGKSDRTAKPTADSGNDKAKAVQPTNSEDSRARIFAKPERKANRKVAAKQSSKAAPRYETFKSAQSGVLRFDPKTMEMKKLREGSKVLAGTVLGRIGKGSAADAPHLNFAIKPAGRGSRKIDPKPILDGWKLLEATAIYRAQGKNPFEDSGASIGQILLASKTQLQAKVLADPRLEIYSCGRDDIRTGQIDRRVLAVLEYLAERGFRLTITSLKCGHGILTTSGNISAHSTGDAVDIAQVNGIPILGNQGRGSITEAVINDLLKLQGTMRPAQIISLMEMGGPTFAMADHDDHIHVGYSPDADSTGPGGVTPSSMLKPAQWDKLLDRIGQLDQPTVPVKPSKFSLPTKGKAKRASNAHVGE